MSSFSFATLQDYLWVATGLTLLVAFISKYIYRLTFHPLAKFPGPKLAAATSLYGAFFDLSPTRSYVKLFPALHDKHGDIVRVWPNQLHVSDIDAYNQIFKIGTKFDKYTPFYANPTMAGNFGIESSQAAVMRRNMYAPSFNREAVRRAEPRISQCTIKFLDKLNRYLREDKPVNMTKGLLCLMADGVMNFVYQEPFGALDGEDFDSELIIPIVESIKVIQWPFYFPKVFGTIFRMTGTLPEWAREKWLKGFESQKQCLQTCCDRIVYLSSHSPRRDRPPTVFDTTLEPNLEKGQFTPPVKNLAADAFAFMAAGTDTSTNTVVTALFNLVHGSPHRLARLKSELVEGIPDINSIVGWESLEKLPYLRAVIKESLRLSYGVPGRVPRLVPENTVLCGQKIPTGTVVSSCIYVHNMNPSVFPSPEDFRPERWLDGDPLLDQHLCSFSRGSRICIGMNLAYCELYLTLGHLLRRFDLKLYETTEDDMEWKDSFTPVRKGHLKVTLTRVEE